MLRMRNLSRGLAAACAATLVLGLRAVPAPAQPFDILPAGENRGGHEGLRRHRHGGREGDPAVRRRDPRPAQALRARAGPDPRPRLRHRPREGRDHRRDERQPDLRRRQARGRARLRLAVLQGPDLRHHADPEHARHPPRARGAARSDRGLGRPPPGPSSPLFRPGTSRTAGRTSCKPFQASSSGSLAALPLPVSFGGAIGPGEALRSPRRGFQLDGGAVGRGRDEAPGRTVPALPPGRRSRRSCFRGTWTCRPRAR